MTETADLGTATRRQTPPGFWAVWTAVAVDLLGFGIIIPLLPLYAEDFGAGPAVVGLLFAAYSLAQFVFSPIWGRISDRVGRRPVLLVTIAGSAIGSLILGLAGSLAVLFVGRIVDGISGASVAVARATVADRASPSEQARLMGLLGAAFGVGFVLGPVIGGLAALAGPSVPFFVAAAISVINFASTWFRLPETRTAGDREADVSHAPLAGRLLRLIAVTFVALTAFSAFEATFSLLADQRLGLTESQVALVFAGVGLVLVGTQGGAIGPISRAVGEVRTIRIGLVANVLGFGLLAVAGRWPALAGGLALLAFGQGLITPTLSSLVATASTGRAGAGLGYQQSAGGLARVVGPAVGGVLFGVASWQPYVLSAVAALALLLVPLGES